MSKCIMVMGVSGCGKTTIARLLAEKLALPFLEADDFHPIANKEKMAAGVPLEDADRFPWLEAIGQTLEEEEKKVGFVLACSALKESYRQILQSYLKEVLQIVFLQGTYTQIWERMQSRKGHFMPPSLLQSQFDTLEIPKEAIYIDIQQSPKEMIDEIIVKF